MNMYIQHIGLFINKFYFFYRVASSMDVARASMRIFNIP